MIGRHTALPLLSFATALLCAATLLPASSAAPRASAAVSEAESIAAFEAIVPTMHHPRCMNCHMSGDYPRQGDDSHPHIMAVRRGPSGHGANAVQCSTCHGDHNLSGVHMPPGAPDWALPPPATPMIWEGLTDRQLCLLLKDPAQNGHRSVVQIVEHMHTPLVLWGWNPGDGRTPIPQQLSSFLNNVQRWADGGAACPVAIGAPR